MRLGSDLLTRNQRRWMRLAVNQRQHFWLVNGGVCFGGAVRVKHFLRFPPFVQQKSGGIVVRLVDFESIATRLFSRHGGLLNEQAANFFDVSWVFNGKPNVEI